MDPNVPREYQAAFMILLAQDLIEEAPGGLTFKITEKGDRRALEIGKEMPPEDRVLLLVYDWNKYRELFK